MKRIFLIAGVLVLICGAAWYALRSRVRPNPGDAAATTQSADPTKPPASETASADNSPSVAQLSAPSGDTISRNPQNGMVFAGSGKFQLYRQGDITWRLNTDTGWACVLFATDTQWAKSRVFEQGCATPQTVSR
jgi:hypothetical protein